MNTVAVREPVGREKRALRRWSDLENSPFEMLLRGKTNLHREMDRLFEDFFHNGGSSPLLEPWSENVLSPLVDETEDDKAYHVAVELPGMDQDDIDISYSDGLLTISGEKKEGERGEEKGLLPQRAPLWRVSACVVPARCRGRVEDSGDV